MSKHLSIKITETNMDKLSAFAMVKKTGGEKASDYKGKPFRVAGYAFSHNELTDDETGEVTSMETLTLLTTEGVTVGTNSPTLQSNFKDILSLITEMEMDVKDIELIITGGKSNNGREFSTIELVL